MGRTSENQPQKASGASCALKQKKLKIQKLDKKNCLATEVGWFIGKIKSIHSKKINPTKHAPVSWVIHLER